MKTFAGSAVNFFTSLKNPVKLPAGISVINPYESEERREIVAKFYDKYFNDSNQRIFIVGINPGRFGGGSTGIAFTDPFNLEKYCGIKNNLNKQTELSSKFIYKLINNVGGPEKFYGKFFLTALYPLALINKGKNFNYYDSKEVYNSLKDEIINSFKNQLSFGADKNVVICLGKKNNLYLKEINNELNYFEKIIVFDHPRYIMQYKFKNVNDYILQYNQILNEL